MNNNRQKMVLSVNVHHTYFENNICNCLQFYPDAATDKILNRFSFSIGLNTNGFDLYTNSRVSLIDLFTYIGKTTQQSFFQFTIKAADPEFVFFTELPINWCGEIVYQSSDDSNVYHDDTLNICGVLSNQASTSLGKLIIYFDDVLKYQNTKDISKFKIEYKARATQWQYFIINTNLVGLIDPVITGKTGIRFEGPETVTIETGQQALLFSSGKNLIPLSNTVQYKFDLLSHTSVNQTATRVIFKSLPNPAPKRIGAVVNKNQVSSPMYIYI